MQYSVWFQQDGAAPHIAQTIMTKLRHSTLCWRLPSRLTLLHLTFFVVLLQTGCLKSKTIKFGWD